MYDNVYIGKYNSYVSNISKITYYVDNSLCIYDQYL